MRKPIGTFSDNSYINQTKISQLAECPFWLFHCIFLSSDGLFSNKAKSHISGYLWPWNLLIISIIKLPLSLSMLWRSGLFLRIWRWRRMPSQPANKGSFEKAWLTTQTSETRPTVQALTRSAASSTNYPPYSTTQPSSTRLLGQARANRENNNQEHEITLTNSK